MTGVSGADLEDLFDQAKSALAALGAGPGTGEGEGDRERSADAPAEGRGEAADGLVRATVSASGRIERIELAPRAMRLPSEEIGAHVATAVNAAFGDLRQQPSASPAAADAERLTAHAREIQDLGMRQMRQATRSISDLMAQLHAERR